MYKITMYCLLAVAAAQNGGNLDSVIKDIFGEPPVTPGTTNKDGGSTPAPAKPPVPPAATDSNEDTACTTEGGEAGECVKYYLCNTNNSVIDDGTGIIDIRVQGGACSSYLDVCCLVGDKRDDEDPITPKPEPAKTSCGWRNAQGVGFKTVGDKDGEAKFGEFPWMAAIIKVEPVNENQPDGQKLNVYVGGGSLIHPSVVLTAAHNVAARPQLKVRAGEWDTQTAKEIYPYQDRDVDAIEVHKDFNKGNLFYDVALLFLKAPMDMVPNVGVVCLPPAREKALGGTRCFASGWGKDSFGKEGRYQVILKKVEVPVVENSQCQAALRTTRLSKHFILHSSFMCAGGEEGSDTCKGDGGSPLVCPMENEVDRYVQNGIVAWGIGCKTKVPGVYVDVANVRDWIDDKVKGHGYQTNSYDGVLT